jgi:hypothetical protein
MTKLVSKYFFLFILSLNAIKAQNNFQNLIPNGSFEKMKSFSIDSFSLLSQQDPNWIEYFGSNYFLSQKFAPISNIPRNTFGFQYPQHGSNYYYLGEFGNDSKCPSPAELRSYAQIKLHRKLRKKKMKGVLYVSLVDTMEFAISRIGLFFSNNKPTPQFLCSSNSCPYISAIPQIQRPFGQAVTDKISWTKIEGIFEGNGEEWLSLGNFYNDANTDTVRVVDYPDSIAGCIGEGAAYYIDNLSLVEEDLAVAYFDTTKKYLCVQQGTSKVLGDTLVRPWLFYLWRNANGDSVGNMRNYTYNAAVLENTFFTLEITDTGEYAFITKPIDTIYVSSSISGLGCTYVGVEDVMKDAEAIDFYFVDNQIIFNTIHERFVNSDLVIKSIDGKVIFKTKINRNQNIYTLDKEIPNGFYFMEVAYEGNSIKRKKLHLLQTK